MHNSQKTWESLPGIKWLGKSTNTSAFIISTSDFYIICWNKYKLHMRQIYGSIITEITQSIGVYNGKHWQRPQQNGSEHEREHFVECRKHSLDQWQHSICVYHVS